MNELRLGQFKELYEQYKLSSSYQERVNQFVAVPVFREIIKETLSNNPLTNSHLTGLIQIFKYNCSADSFDYYLEQNIPNKGRAIELSKQIKLINQKGYTNAGKASINDLSQNQLNEIQRFLQKAFTISTIEDAIKLCKEVDNKDIPQVKKGIYSPWLHYINPEIFPIANNTHDEFREWIGIPSDYPSNIRDFNYLKTLVNENDLGVLDKFAYQFSSEEDFWDIDNFIESLNNHFKKVWRCATSNVWNDFRDKNILSINWLDANTDYSTLKTFMSGKMSTRPWTHELLEGNLIVVLDKYQYYGIAVAKSTYKYKENDIEFNGKIWPSINVEFLHKLEKPVNHNMSITHTNPATFFMLNGLGFSAKETFKFIKKSFPEAISKVVKYMGIDTTVAIYPTDNDGIKNIPMNTILYGPPGTGKTYSTIDESIKILEPDFSDDDRQKMKEKFSEYQKAQRVFFTTFHQNMAYEDFIEGIKPLEPGDDNEFLGYEIKDGLFKIACVEATFNYIQSNFKQDKTVSNILDFNSLFDKLYETISSNESTVLATKSGGKITAGITTQGNFIINHKESNRQYTVSRDRLSKLFEKYPNPDTISNVQDAFRKVIGGCNSTAYWSILKELSILRDKNSGSIISKTSEQSDIIYDDKRKIVQQYWDKKEYDVLDKDYSKPYVFIIDEINRGNVAQIFGELITLIEDDKRMGKLETIYAELPYSKHSFSIPPNLYIIGTMNTADRSVEALDTALRRRFSFIAKHPEPNKLKITEDSIDLPSMLQALNTRLEILKDNDHTIGHAWLMNVKNLDQLQLVFGNKILPLLQEYFYNDYEKLGLVLGDAFFEIYGQVNSKIFASFSGGNGLAGQYDQSWQYKLKPVNELTVEDFQTLEVSNIQTITGE